MMHPLHAALLRATRSMDSEVLAAMQRNLDEQVRRSQQERHEMIEDMAQRLAEEQANPVSNGAVITLYSGCLADLSKMERIWTEFYASHPGARLENARAVLEQQIEEITRRAEERRRRTIEQVTGLLEAAQGRPEPNSAVVVAYTKLLADLEALGRRPGMPGAAESGGAAAGGTAAGGTATEHEGGQVDRGFPGAPGLR